MVPADGEAEAGAFGLGGEERLEQMQGRIGRYAGPLVAHDDLGFVRADAHGAEHDPSSRGRQVAERFHRVAQQVEHHLLDLHAIDDGGQGAAVDVELQAHVVLPHVARGQIHRFARDVVQILAPLFGLAIADEVAQTPDHLAGPQGLVGDLLQRVLHGRDHRRGAREASTGDFAPRCLRNQPSNPTGPTMTTYAKWRSSTREGTIELPPYRR